MSGHGFWPQPVRGRRCQPVLSGILMVVVVSSDNWCQRWA